MPLINANKFVAAAIQNTRPTPVPIQDLIPIRAFDLTSSALHGIRVVERPSMMGHYGMERPLYGGSLSSVTLSWRITPLTSALANATPEQDAFYRMAGLTATTTAGLRTYTLTSEEDQLPYGTIAYFFDGKIRYMEGCVCSAFAFAFEAGGYMTATATYVGYLRSEVDAPVPAAIGDFGTTDPLLCLSATTTFDGVQHIVPTKSLAINFNLETPDRGDMGHKEGYAPPVITNRKIGGTLVLESTKNAIVDWVEEVQQSADIALRFSTTNPHAFFAAAPHMSLTNAADGDDSGVITTELTMEFGKTGAGNDEFSFGIGA